MSLQMASSSRSRDDATTVVSQDSSIPAHDFLDHILQVAIEASRKAGDIIVGNAGGAQVTERKANSRDLLTLIDPLCEKVCILC
jgi:myo-inositol-1(or 4)-monophosphatase